MSDPTTTMREVAAHITDQLRRAQIVHQAAQEHLAPEVVAISDNVQQPYVTVYLEGGELAWVEIAGDALRDFDADELSILISKTIADALDYHARLTLQEA